MSPGNVDPSSGCPPTDSRLPTCGHLLLTYRGETPPWRSVVAFLMAGLADDRRLVYLHDRSDPGEIVEQLRGADLDVDQLESSGQLLFLAAEEHYVRDSGSEPDHLVQALRSGLVDAVRSGFDGLQVVGEAGWVGDSVPTGTLIEFERRTDEVLGRELVDVLCLYPDEEWDDPVLDALIEVHEEHFHHTGSDDGELERLE